MEVEMAHSPIEGEVEPIDVILLETLRSVFPDVYQEVRLNGEKLTDTQGADLFDIAEEKSKKFVEEFQHRLPADSMVHRILGWLFPDYDASHQWRYKRSEERAERRAWKSDRFQIYFRSAVPSEVFSEAEVREVLDDLRQAEGVEGTLRVLQERFSSLSAQPAKRADFLSRLRFCVDKVTASTARHISVALCRMSGDFSYDRAWGFSESGHALEFILSVWREVGDVGRPELIRSLLRATADDTFAYRLFKKATDAREGDLSQTEVPPILAAARRAFVGRMRERYTPGKEPIMSFGDHQAFREWMNLEKDDISLIQHFFHDFVGNSLRRLAQVRPIIYPDGFWTTDPRPLFECFLPIATARVILTQASREGLTADEEMELERLDRFILKGEYISEPGGGFVSLPASPEK
jgi:hypothetical protein